MASIVIEVKKIYKRRFRKMMKDTITSDKNKILILLEKFVDQFPIKYQAWNRKVVSD